MDGKTCCFRLVQHVSTAFDSFGVLLGFTINQLEGWKIQYQGNLTLCWNKMIECWLIQNGTPEYPATWEGLYKLLKDAEFPTKADKLRTAVASAICTTPVS